MERLLQPLLKDCAQSITVTLETTTLHIVCRHDQVVVPQTYAVKRISELLNEIAPQGIRGASIYGVVGTSGDTTGETKSQTTEWTHLIDRRQVKPVSPFCGLRLCCTRCIRRTTSTDYAINTGPTNSLGSDFIEQFRNSFYGISLRDYDLIVTTNNM